MYTWHGQGLALGLPEDDSLGWPGWKSNVTIKRCQHIILDVDINIQMYSLVVWGTLEIENREDANVFLRSTCVTVKCANPACPALRPHRRGLQGRDVQGAAGGLLSGDELTESHQCGGLTGKHFIVESGGIVELYGNHPKKAWGSQTAEKGAQTLYIIGMLDFKPGDEAIIGTTGADASETEWKTVFATRYVPDGHGGWDTEINTASPLKYRHVGVTEQHGQHTLDMRAEVGCYLRPVKPFGPAYPTIRIAGVDSLHWDFKFKTMAKSFFGAILRLEPGSNVTMHGVRLEDGTRAQAEPGHAALQPEGRADGAVLWLLRPPPKRHRPAARPRRRDVASSDRAPRGERLLAVLCRRAHPGAVDPAQQCDLRLDERPADAVRRRRPRGERLRHPEPPVRRAAGHHRQLRRGRRGAVHRLHGLLHAPVALRERTTHGCLIGFGVKGKVTQPIQDSPSTRSATSASGATRTRTRRR